MQTMETSKNANRFDGYLSVHKGLRAFMSDVLTTIGRTDASDAAEVAEGMARVRSLLDICRGHLFTENQFLHTAMEARQPGSACVTANDHVQQEENFELLESRILAVERSSSANRPSNLLQLYRTLALFVAENFQHMNVEELDNNETLWSLYTDAELHAIHEEILKSIDPEKMRVFLRWILPYVSPAERTAIVTGMQQSMPEPVFEQFLSAIRQLLSEKDWTRLNDQILLLN
jgi:hypothetical protein